MKNEHMYISQTSLGQDFLHRRHKSSPIREEKVREYVALMRCQCKCLWRVSQVKWQCSCSVCDCESLHTHRQDRPGSQVYSAGIHKSASCWLECLCCCRAAITSLVEQVLCPSLRAPQLPEGGSRQTQPAQSCHKCLACLWTAALEVVGHPSNSIAHIYCSSIHCLYWPVVLRPTSDWIAIEYFQRTVYSRKPRLGFYLFRK